MIKTSAPGKIILFGEHAVVYDKLSIAASIDKRAYVIITLGKGGLTVNSKNLNIQKSLSQRELFNKLREVNKLKEKKYFDKIKELGKRDLLLPTFIVITNIMEKHEFKDANVFINSEVHKNLGSSSSVFSATALAISKFLGKDISKKEISNFAYEGDVIAHGGTPSGLDNNIVTYGGYVKFRKSEGITPIDINFKLPLIIVDSGEPARTGETVPAVRKLREEKPELVNTVLDKLDKISHQGLDALKSQNLEKIGTLMTDYYNELKKLGISTNSLDKIIEIAIKNKALGAKPTGGWGGGCCIVLAKNPKEANKLEKTYKKAGFSTFQTKLGVEGVRLEKEL